MQFPDAVSVRSDSRGKSRVRFPTQFIYNFRISKLVHVWSGEGFDRGYLPLTTLPAKTHRQAILIPTRCFVETVRGPFKSITIWFNVIKYL